VVYATGLGPVSVPVGDGQLAPAQRLAYTIESPTALVGRLPAEVLFSGLVPGFAGVYQVNIRMPRDIWTGSQVLLTLRAGDKSASILELKRPVAVKFLSTGVLRPVDDPHAALAELLLRSGSVRWCGRAS
jgi:hypothetical protein